MAGFFVLGVDHGAMLHYRHVNTIAARDFDHDGYHLKNGWRIARIGGVMDD